MPTALLLQDWITIRTTNDTFIIQDSALWPDCEAFADLVAYLETGESLATPTIFLETSPSRDPSMFRTMTGATAAVATMTKYTWLVRLASASEPLARYVRWTYRGAAAATTSATFRIWLSLNAHGGFGVPFPRITSSMRDR